MRVSRTSRCLLQRGPGPGHRSCPSSLQAIVTLAVCGDPAFALRACHQFPQPRPRSGELPLTAPEYVSQ
jgi:hypothetical protein